MKKFTRPISVILIGSLLLTACNKGVEPGPEDMTCGGGTETMTDVEEYYETLIGIYGTEIPIFCITPLWRGDNPDGVPTLIKFCENIKKIVSAYPNITVIDGFTLVPHLPEYFLDNLHPNALGTEVYGREVAERVKG